MRKEIGARKEKLTKRKDAATRTASSISSMPSTAWALKRLKRAQRKLADEAIRLRPRKPVEAVPAAAAAATPAAAAPAAAQQQLLPRKKRSRASC